MRVFEDEIIKRIKIIQSFVKSLDNKVLRLKNRNIRAKNSSDGLDKGSKPPASGIQGGLTEDQVKDAIKWDLEVAEKKLDDRIKFMEGQMKKFNKRLDDSQRTIMEETNNEFINVKA